ncbi:hypothetical protein ANMWB30_23260 [Arthrobacter sp. MWB30]|nr:hypothetical protein ANMWB30_23260 [Arthrobacter sp. MWB30]
MNAFANLATRATESVLSTRPLSTLPTAEWDLKSFFDNAGEYAKTVGGSFLMALGIVAIIVGAYKGIKKLISGQQNNDNWVTVALLIIIGGAIAVGGFNLVFTVGSGGKTTIEDLGGGTFLWNAAQPLGALFGLG